MNFIGMSMVIILVFYYITGTKLGTGMGEDNIEREIAIMIVL
jgi:hypothetical protein